MLTWVILPPHFDASKQYPMLVYYYGGCSPVGMKKQYPTYFDESILRDREIALSAGKRGYQMIVNANDIVKYTNAKVGPVLK